MGIELSPERQAFVDREVARGAGTPEQIAERALQLYEQQLERVRAEIAGADGQIRRGESIVFDPAAFSSGQDAKFSDRVKNAAD